MDIVRFEDRNLEDLRRLLTMKEAVSSSAFAALAEELENDSLRAALTDIREEAAGELAELTSVVRAWMDEGGSRAAPEVDARDLVYQWADLHEASGRRLRTAAAYAPNGDLRDRLRHLASRDEAHARKLRNLL